MAGPPLLVLGCWATGSPSCAWKPGLTPKPDGRWGIYDKGCCEEELFIICPCPSTSVTVPRALCSDTPV